MGRWHVGHFPTEAMRIIARGKIANSKPNVINATAGGAYMHAMPQTGKTTSAHAANQSMFLRHCEGSTGGAACGSNFFIELVFLRNRVTPKPVVITPERNSATRTPSLAAFRTSIKSTAVAAASYPAIIA